MKRFLNKTLLSLLAVCAFSQLRGQDTIRVMSYNLYRFPDNPPANRELILKEILDTYTPDIFMVCELISEQGATLIKQNSLPADYGSAQFVLNQSNQEDTLQQLIFFNNKKFRLTAQQSFPTAVRDINHYRLQTLNADSTIIHAFVAHLKSSESVADRNARAAMVDTFLKVLDTLPANSYVLMGGDFNFYNSANEGAWQKITAATNPIIMVDPLNQPGKWHDDSTFSYLHTQATRTSATGFGLGGATGGMDDRFDFIFMSQNFTQNGELGFVPDSYLAYGNNGNCFNKKISDSTCTGPYSQTLRQYLHDMSDHLPVVMQLVTQKPFVTGIVPGEKTNNTVRFAGANLVAQTISLQASDANIWQKARIDIYDQVGVARPLQFSFYGNRAEADAAGLPAGIYNMRVILPQGVVLFRFLKM
ncbi:MAG: hypothetical protein QM642_07030 [Edaphocola sp.]